MIDAEYVIPWTITLINTVLNLLYDFVIVTLEEYTPVIWVIRVMALSLIPLQLIVHAGRYTLSSFYGGRRMRKQRQLNHRRCRSIRIRVLLATLPFTAGVVHSTKRTLGYTTDPSCTCSSGTTGRNDQKYFCFNINTPSRIESPLILDHWRHPTQPSSMDIEAFLQQIDVLEHYRTISTPSATTGCTSTYTKLSSTSPTYRSIFFQARSLKSILQHYDQPATMDNPSIYVSSKPTELPIVIDTGASCSVTPIATDFVGGIPSKCTKTTRMEGLNGEHTPVLGAGPISWDIEDVDGVRAQLKTIAYYAPKAQIRLFSPQAFFAEQSTLNNLDLKLYVSNDDATLEISKTTTLRFPIQQTNKLPLMLTHQALHPAEPTTQQRHSSTANRFTNFANFLCSEAFNYFNKEMSFVYNNSVPAPRRMDDIKDIQSVLKQSNWNLTDEQRELLLWHSRLGHIGFKQVQSLLAKPRDPNQKRIIKPRNNKCSHCQLPLCEACQYAKQKRHNPPSQLTTSRKELEGGLSADKLNPGDRVSVDLYQSPVRGRLPDTFGKEKPDKQYTGGAIFIDHAT